MTFSLLALALPVVAAWPDAGHAAPDPPNPCEQSANDTAQRLGTTVDKTDKPGEYLLGQSSGTRLSFSCPVGNQRYPRLHLGWQATYPPRAFWDAVSRAGTVLTGASARREKLAAHQCHKAATARMTNNNILIEIRCW